MKKKATKQEQQDFIKNFFYRYEIKWLNGRTDILEPHDAPITWPVELTGNFAIVSAANPNGQKLLAEQNEKLNDELESLLDILGIPFLEARRFSLDEQTLEPDGIENSRAFFLIDPTYSQAFVLASQFMQRGFVFYESDCPDDLKVELRGCSWRFTDLKATIFRYEN